MKTIVLPHLRKLSSGKVREIFQLDGKLLLVATDRISAFDVVLPNTIPCKGAVLTQLSAFWFDFLREVGPNHFISMRVEDFPEVLKPFSELLKGRSMLVTRCQPLPVECVVRGYLAGSGWREYAATGQVCGLQLKPDLRESEALPEPIFTPATKSVSGHDENITFDQVVERIGGALAERARSFSLSLYYWAHEYALRRGIIIADTKFEFGLFGQDLLLIDEALTPDSSRFWPAHQHKPGQPQPSFDKQFIRDYLEGLDWDKRPPGPTLPRDVVEATSNRYREVFRILTGTEVTCS